MNIVLKIFNFISLFYIVNMKTLGVCHFKNFYYINLYFVVVHFRKHGVL